MILLLLCKCLQSWSELLTWTLVQIPRLWSVTLQCMNQNQRQWDSIGDFSSTPYLTFSDLRFFSWHVILAMCFHDGTRFWEMSRSTIRGTNAARSSVPGLSYTSLSCSMTSVSSSSLLKHKLVSVSQTVKT